jgi:hypothetical protein
VKLYAKFLAQVAGALLAAILPAVAAGDGHVDQSEWVNAIILGLGALLVLSGGELPAGVWSKAKFYISAVLAAMVVLQSALSDGMGITTAEWWQVAIALLTAAGVLVAPGPVVYTDPTAAGAAGAGLRPGPAV